MKTKNIMLVLLLLVIGVSIFAQTTQTTAAEQASKVTLGGIFKDSGFWRYPILLVFVLGIVYAIVKYIQLYQREKIDARKFYLKLKGYIKNDQVEEAAKIAESFNKTTMGFIFWSGLRVYIDSRKANLKGEELTRAVQNAFEEAVLQTVYKLDAGLFWFTMLAQVATYLGLLGTIWGLLDAFNALANAPESQRSALLTNGIKVAIGTTAMGLFAAIPLTVIQGIFHSRAERMTNEIDEHTVKLINTITMSIKG
jgi:biopolymer transport protein ExbB/TolQ